MLSGTPVNYFSAYVYASHFILGVLVRRAIQFWAFCLNILAYNTPVNGKLVWNPRYQCDVDKFKSV